MKRSPSAGYGFEPNKNTDWLEDRNFFVYYTLLVCGMWVMISMLAHFLHIFPSQYTWTATHITHTIVSFIMLHWLKGTPFQLAEDQGRYDQDTFWEQIDHGRQGTWNRRVFTTVPVVIFLIASYFNHWETSTTIVNVIFLLVAIVPKFDAMDHVRIAGINED